MALRAGRSDGRLGGRPARPRSGACVTPRSGLQVSTKRASEAPNRIHDRDQQAHSGVAGSAAARGLARWTGPLLAAALCDVDVQYVWRFLRDKIRPCPGQILVPLFAAFEVATGKVTAAHKTRRRRIEFLDFMNEIVAAHADAAIHVVLDNLNTHKPRNDRWLKRHPNVHFHFTPTRASWLNQVEIWFSILQGQSLHGASFTSVKQLREHIDAFIKAYNTNATPFVWTKSEVHHWTCFECSEGAVTLVDFMPVRGMHSNVIRLVVGKWDRRHGARSLVHATRRRRAIAARIWWCCERTRHPSSGNDRQTVRAACGGGRVDRRGGLSYVGA